MPSTSRRRALLGLVACCAGGSLSCTPSSSTAETPAWGDAAPGLPTAGVGGLVVHEWGTLTTMEGSNGASLEGLQHETEAVPAFVHRNIDSYPSPFAHLGDSSRDATVRGARSKMETPVIYFYSDTAQRVSVEVDFVRGLLTHWYPRHASASPEIEAARSGGVDLGGIGQSTLRWEVELVPPGQAPPREIPAVDADDAWQLARETRAATLRTVPATGAGDAEAAPTEAEHYIFYRGLGQLELPLQAVSGAGGQVIVMNHGTAEIAASFVLDMQGERGRYHRLGRIPAHGAQPVAMGAQPSMPAAALVATLERDMTAALVEQGLFADEARAMVRTWSRAWFASEGTRVLYVLPRDVVDRVLPLRIDPRPETLVRVLVGRHEYLTPEVEAEVEALLRARVSADERAAAAAMGRLGRIGRFLEPSIRAVMARTADPSVLRSAREVLAAFRAP
ncbi:MAG: hypothetical protein WKG00_10870 [Polyangiaceae bacterium]